MAAIVISTISWSLGIAMCLCLAGLKDISADLQATGALDNATGATAFRYSTVLNRARRITLVVVLQINLHFLIFGQSHLMTTAGPTDTTQMPVRYVYQTDFRGSVLGRGAAAVAVRVPVRTRSAARTTGWLWSSRIS